MQTDTEIIEAASSFVAAAEERFADMKKRAMLMFIALPPHVAVQWLKEVRQSGGVPITDPAATFDVAYPAKPMPRVVDLDGQQGDPVKMAYRRRVQVLRHCLAVVSDKTATAAQVQRAIMDMEIVLTTHVLAKHANKKRMRVKRLRAKARSNIIPKSCAAPNCTEALDWKRHKRRKYCSDKCRVAAHRAKGNANGAQGAAPFA